MFYVSLINLILFSVSFSLYFLMCFVVFFKNGSLFSNIKSFSLLAHRIDPSFGVSLMSSNRIITPSPSIFFLKFDSTFNFDFIHTSVLLLAIYIVRRFKQASLCCFQTRRIALRWNLSFCFKGIWINYNRLFFATHFAIFLVWYIWMARM